MLPLGVGVAFFMVINFNFKGVVYEKHKEKDSAT